MKHPNIDSNGEARILIKLKTLMPIRKQWNKGVTSLAKDHIDTGKYELIYFFWLSLKFEVVPLIKRKMYLHHEKFINTQINE